MPTLSMQVWSVSGASMPLSRIHIPFTLMVSPSEILATPVIVVAAAAIAKSASSIVAAIRRVGTGRTTMRVLSAVSTWIERRRQSRRLFQDDARQLIERAPTRAYYDAQRLAARARFAGDGQAFLHWAKVAAEVARIGNAPMNYETVKAIVAEEERRAKPWRTYEHGDDRPT